jgi:hypothetical protein
VRQWGKHRTADRLAEKAGTRRVFVFICPQGSLSSAAALIFFCGRLEGLEGNAARSFARQRNLPCGASDLGVGPAPDDTAAICSLLFPTLSTRSIRALRGQRKGQEVGHAKLAKREERPSGQTSGP